MVLTAKDDKHLRRFKRMQNWSREKLLVFQARVDGRILAKLNREGTGKQVPYEQDLGRRKLQAAINRRNKS